MVDMRPTVIAKSDQMNADDLIGRPITITITKVSGGPKDQPVSINYEGDGGKPFKPCKSMRRVLIEAWGDDGQQYIGRSMTLFRDENVKWGGVAVGGIRISHMSHIDKPFTLSLAVTRGKKAPNSVQPLRQQQQQLQQNSAGAGAPNAPEQSVQPNDSQQTTGGEAAGEYEILLSDGAPRLFPDLNSVQSFIVANLKSFSSSEKIDDFLKRNNDNFYEYSRDDPDGIMNQIYSTLKKQKEGFLNV